MIDSFFVLKYVECGGGNAHGRLHEKNAEYVWKLQKKVADYIRANFGELAFITLDQVARQADVSTATVIRFAQAMGYSGYADMQRDIINAVRGNVGLPERLENMCKSTG